MQSRKHSSRLISMFISVSPWELEKEAWLWCGTRKWSPIIAAVTVLFPVIVKKPKYCFLLPVVGLNHRNDWVLLRRWSLPRMGGGLSKDLKTNPSLVESGTMQRKLFRGNNGAKDSAEKHFFSTGGWETEKHPSSTNMLHNSRSNLRNGCKPKSLHAIQESKQPTLLAKRKPPDQTNRSVMLYLKTSARPPVLSSLSSYFTVLWRPHWAQSLNRTPEGGFVAERFVCFSLTWTGFSHFWCIVG